MKNISELKAFFLAKDNSSSIGFTAAKELFEEFVVDFGAWVGSSGEIEVQHYKTQYGGIGFKFSYSYFEFKLFCNEKRQLQLDIEVNRVLCTSVGLPTSFSFSSTSFEGGWDAIYAKLKEDLHANWQASADRLIRKGVGHGYERLDGCEVRPELRNGFVSFRLYSKGSPCGAANLREVIRIKAESGETFKDYWLLDHCHTTKFGEFRPFYSLHAPVVEFEQDGETMFKLRLQGREMVFSIAKVTEDLLASFPGVDPSYVQIESLYVHDLTEKGRKSEWQEKEQIDQIQCYLNLVKRHPERIVAL